jgi:hypothetical protein
MVAVHNGLGLLGLPELLVLLAVAIFLFGTRGGKFGSDLAQVIRSSIEEMRFRREWRLQPATPQWDPVLLAILVLSGILIVLLVTLVWLHS